MYRPQKAGFSGANPLEGTKKGYYMRWLRSAQVTDEMLNHFNKRTKLHIDLVKKYCKKIAEAFPQFQELVERGEVHDASKYEEPEKTPYIYVSWQYKCKDDGREFKAPEGMKEKMNQATEHHVHTNKHHPEAHGKTTGETINREDRDKPPKEKIDATAMLDLDIAEMVADWCGMAEERGNTPQEWADKTVGVRWMFTDPQKKLMYDIMNKVFK